MYPEHERIKQFQGKSEIIGTFLEWQKTKNRDLCEFNSEYEDYMPVLHGSIEKILAEYFEIDLLKLEKEKIQIIEELRKLNG